MGGNQQKLAAVIAHLRGLAAQEGRPRTALGSTGGAPAVSSGSCAAVPEAGGPALLPPPSLPSLPPPIAPPLAPPTAADKGSDAADPLPPPSLPSLPPPIAPSLPPPLAPPTAADEGSDAADPLPPLEGHTPRCLAQGTPGSGGLCSSGTLGRATPPHCSTEPDITDFQSVGSPRGSSDLCSVAVTTLSGDFAAGVVPREMALLSCLPEHVGMPPYQAAPRPPPAGLQQQQQQQQQQYQQQQQQQGLTPPLPPMMGQGMNPMMVGNPMGVAMNPMMMGMNPMVLAMGQGGAMFPQMNPMMVGMPQGPALDQTMGPLMMGMGAGGMPPMVPMNVTAPPLGRTSPPRAPLRKAATCMSLVQFPDSYLPAESRRCVRCAQAASEAYLMYVDENCVQQQFHMTAGAKDITIGRHTTCTLCLCRRDQTISRMHAAVRCVRNSDVGHTTAFILRDTSTTGTAVNGERLTKPRELRDGDHIFLGQCPVSLFFFRPNTCDNPAFEGILGIPGTGITKKWTQRHCCITQDLLLLFKKKNVGQTPRPPVSSSSLSRRLVHTHRTPSQSHSSNSAVQRSECQTSHPALWSSSHGTRPTPTSATRLRSQSSG